MKKILQLTLMISIAAFSYVQASEVYDLSTSFTPSDPNISAPWSLGRSTDLTAESFVLNTAYDDSGFWGEGPGAVSVWWNETNQYSPFPGGWPLIWHSFTYTETGTGYVIEPGETQVQTGVNGVGVNGVIRWTAPNEGLLNIDIDVSCNYEAVQVNILLENDPEDDPNTWKIHQDVISGGGSATSYDWTGHHVQAGDLFDISISAPNTSSSVSVAAVFELFALGEPGAPEENNIPSPDTPIEEPFDPNDPNAVLDISEQFSASENPGDYWAYGWGFELDDFNPSDTVDTSTNILWYDSATPTPLAIGPLIWKNLGASSFGVGTSQVACHPSNERVAKVRWTSVINDIVAITGMFGSGDGGTVDVSVVKDGTEILLEAENVAGDVPLDLRTEVVEGTTIDFNVGSGPDFSSENTPVVVQITRGEFRCQDMETHMLTDMNEDCYIDLEDFALFVQDWLKCNDPMDPLCTDVP